MSKGIDFIVSLLKAQEENAKRQAARLKLEEEMKQIANEEKLKKLKEEKKRCKEVTNSLTNFDLPINFENTFNNDDEVKDIHAESASDGLILSLTNRGMVDLEYISKITGNAIPEIIKELKGSIFQNPEIFNESLLKGWESKETYLTGNLAEKLKVAENYNRQYPGYFADNILAINEVLSKMNAINHYDIFVTLGTPWLPVKYIEQFINEVIMASVNYRYNFSVIHDSFTGTWTIKHNLSKYRARYYVATSSTFGTKRMHAIDIIENTLNQTNIVVYDDGFEYRLGKDGKYSNVKVKIKNVEESLLALEKQTYIINCFQNWIFKDEKRKQDIVSLYNKKYRTNFVREYDGSYFSFPDLNPEIHLYDYQRNAIARIIFSSNTLLAHDVGSGKTYEMVAAAHEMKRMHLSNKNLFVVPNDILGQWERMYKLMYPKANIYVIHPKDFTPNKKDKVLANIKNNDYEAILMAYSSFDMIDVSPDFKKEQHDQYVAEIDNSFNNTSTCTSTVKSKHTYFHSEKANAKFLAKVGEREEGRLYFDDLGIDRLFLDECHNYKNVPIATNISALGINTQGSDKCLSMKEKCAYIQKTHQGKGLIFASGTPITNSISDLYNIQRYLQEGELDVLGLKAFNSWISNFAEKKERFEIDVDTNNYRMVTRYDRFQNLPELAALLTNIADFHHMDKAKDLPDYQGPINVLVPNRKEFLAYLNDISLRADLIRSHKPRVLRPKGKEDEKDVLDNMLVVTTDGRKAALDIRLVKPNIPYSSSSKVYECAKNVYGIYTKYNDIKGTQLIFSDVSTPKDDFNIYNELKRLLIEFGVNSEDIEFIHNAKSKAQRESFFKRVRDGKIRILIGSTSKLATGVNVQDRLIAIHHIDVPWRPSDMVQREGRILRQGNTNKEIYIFRYICEHSFDAYSWQLLETKQTFISSLLNNEVVTRHANDVEDSVLSYAEVKALATGNEKIKERMEVANELARNIYLKDKDSERKDKLKGQIEYINAHKDDWTKEVANYKLDYDFSKSEKAKLIETKDDSERKAFREKLYHQIMDVLNAKHSKEVVITTYRGFTLVAPSANYALNEDNTYIYIDKNIRHHVKIGDSILGFITRLNFYIDNTLEEEYLEHKSKLEINLRQANEASKEIGRDYGYGNKIKELTTKLADIDKELGIIKTNK